MKLIYFSFVLFIFAGCSKYDIQTSIPSNKIHKPILLNKEYKNYSLNSSSYIYSQYKNKIKEENSFLKTTVYTKKNTKIYKGSIGNKQEVYSFIAKKVYNKGFNTIIKNEKLDKGYLNFLKVLIEKNLKKFEGELSNISLKNGDKVKNIKDLTKYIKKNSLIEKFIPKSLFYTVEGVGKYENKEVVISKIDIKKSNILVDSKTNLNLSFFIKGILLHEIPYKTPKKFNIKLQFDLFTYKPHLGEYFKDYTYKKKIAQVISIGKVQTLEL